MLINEKLYIFYVKFVLAKLSCVCNKKILNVTLFVASTLFSSSLYNKMSSFKQFKFITEDWFTKYTKISNKLEWKLFTKVIKRPSEEALVG